MITKHTIALVVGVCEVAAHSRISPWARKMRPAVNFSHHRRREQCFFSLCRASIYIGAYVSESNLHTRRWSAMRYSCVAISPILISFTTTMRRWEWDAKRVRDFDSVSRDDPRPAARYAALPFISFFGSAFLPTVHTRAPLPLRIWKAAPYANSRQIMQGLRNNVCINQRGRRNLCLTPLNLHF